MKKRGLRRWGSALKNSYNGLCFGLKNEAAIREELIALALSIPFSFLATESTMYRIVLILSVAFVLIVEVLNSAIEATLDRVSDEYHPLTKAAKDLGSFAVTLSIIFSLIIWVTVIFI